MKACAELSAGKEQGLMVQRKSGEAEEWGARDAFGAAAALDERGCAEGPLRCHIAVACKLDAAALRAAAPSRAAASAATRLNTPATSEPGQAASVGFGASQPSSAVSMRGAHPLMGWCPPWPVG